MLALPHTAQHLFYTSTLSFRTFFGPKIEFVALFPVSRNPDDLTNSIKRPRVMAWSVISQPASISGVSIIRQYYIFV